MCLSSVQPHFFSLASPEASLLWWGQKGASPSGRPTLILSRASRFCTSLWMLWATPGYCQEGEGGFRRSGFTHALRTAQCSPPALSAHPPYSPPPTLGLPGSSQPPQSHPLAHLGVPAQWRRQQRALPRERPPCLASPCLAPLLELSERSKRNGYHHGSRQLTSFPVLVCCVS